MNSRLRSFLAFSLIIVSTLLVAAPVQADQQSAAEELQEATDLILSYAKGAPSPPESILESAELLRAYELAPMALVTALSRLQREASSTATRNGLPLALLAGEIIDQQRVVGFPDALDAATRARSKAVAEAQNLAAQLRLDRASAMKAAATPERDRLLLRLDAIGLSVDLLLAPQTVTDSAKAIASRALAPGGDPVAYREAIHALNWSLRDEHKEAFGTIEALQEKARSAFVPNAPIVGIAELDLADTAEAGKHYDAARRALCGARPILDAIPDRLSNPMRYRDLALLVSTLNDADLTAWVRLGFLRGIGYPDVIPDESFRLRLLDAFLSDEKNYPDASIAALDAAIPRLIEADPFRTRMIRELASLLASQNRGAELSAPMAAASNALLAPPTLDEIRALVEKGASTDESAPVREQALRMAIAASPIGGEVPPLDALRARLELVKLLGPLHRVLEAEKLVAQTTTEMQKAGVPAPAANWFLTHAAEHLAEFGSDPAPYFHDRGLQLTADAAWDKLRNQLKAPGPFAPIYDAFSNAVGRQAKVVDKTTAIRKLDEFVPQLTTRLSQGKGPDDLYSFARVYQRALLDAGQDALAGIVAGQAERLAGALAKEPDTYYVDFCKSMLTAGDTRFSAVASTCAGGKVVGGAPVPVVPVTTDASAVDFDPAKIDAKIDALENSPAKEFGSRLEEVWTFMPSLTAGCLALTGAQPANASSPPLYPTCVAASARALGAALRMWRADHERRIDGGDATGANLDTSLISTIVVDAFAQLGPALAEDLSSSGIEPLLDWLWSRRLPDDQATAQTLAQRILHPSDNANRSVLSQREWIRASAALHRALSIKADFAGINLAAASASEAWSRYAALAAPAATPALPIPNLDFHLEALQAALPADQGLVIFSAEPALALVVRHDVVRLRMTQLDSRALAKDVSDYRRELQPSTEIDLPEVDLGLGYSLYRRLFGPVEADLAGVRRLILDLPTELAPLPFSALVTDPPTETSWSTVSIQTPPWLALRWETYVVAHPMLIPLVQGRRPKPRRPNLLLAGDPLLPETGITTSFSSRAILETRGPQRAELVGKMFEPLPGAGAEIQGVAAQAGADHVETLSGAAFTVAALRKAISPQTTHLLLATHAVVGSSGQSFLVTTPTDADDGGVLSAVNILALPLNTDLTVLSACRTGATANATSSFGEITTSLLMAGSKRVVTTLWPIVSEGAAEMTVPFFHGLISDPDVNPASALNAAARRLANGEGGASLRHPAFWAGFVLVGEP